MITPVRLAGFPRSGVAGRADYEFADCVGRFALARRGDHMAHGPVGDRGAEGGAAQRGERGARGHTDAAIRSGGFPAKIKLSGCGRNCRRRAGIRNAPTSYRGREGC